MGGKGIGVWVHGSLLVTLGVLSVLGIAGSLRAQLPVTTLNGAVSDPSGAAVAGAKVTITNKGTNASREATTDSSGLYVLPSLPPGDYKLRVEAAGFAPRDIPEVRLEVGTSVTLNVTLTVGAVAQKVTVSAAPTAAVNLTQSAVSSLITAQTITNIPLNGRNFLELAFLLPGNRPATNFDPTKTNTLEVSSAGQFGRGGNITIDGADNNDAVVGGTLMNFPEDSVREFQIATNRYTAENGDSASSQINIVTQSGTNQYHLDAFVFVRNKNLDARSAVEDRTKPQPPFDRQQFGGSVGGPILKNRAWFFVSGEARDQRAAVQVGEREFAALTPNSYTADGSSVITTAASAPLDDILGLAKSDFRLTGSDSLDLRYSYNRSIEVANGSLQEARGSAANRQKSLNRFMSIYAQWTHTFSPRLLNTVTFNTNPFENFIPSFAPNNQATTVPDLGLTNELDFPSLEDGANFRIPQRTRLTTYETRDDLTWVHGRHTFHFGGRIERTINDALFDLFGSRSIFLTEDFATQDRNGDGVINDLDIPVGTAIVSTSPKRPPSVPFYGNTEVGGYLQDDWRVLSNLTLNLGLRYDIDTSIFGNGDIYKPCPLPLDQPPTSRCVWVRTLLGFSTSVDPYDIGPRFGFAWDPFKKGTTVIRGGYGIYYDRVVTEVDLLEQLVDGRILSLAALTGSTCHNAGTGAVQDCSQPNSRFDTGTPTLQSPFAGTLKPFGIGINVISPDAKHPRVQQFTLGIQHQIGPWLISADGVHDFGYNFLIGRTLRARTASGAFQPITVTDPLTGLTNQVTEITSDGKGWYDGLLVSVQHRPTSILGSTKWRWAYNVNYTLSKSLDYANDDQIPFNVSGQADILFGVQDLRLEKGYAPTDERHRLTLYGVVDAPLNFSIAPILTIASSVPADTLVPSLGTRLPILARNALGRSVTNGRELNTVIAQWNALPACPAGGGTLNCRLTGPLPFVNPNLSFGDKFASLDFRVTKGFTFFERYKLDLIAEMFNVFNVTNIRGFNNKNFSGRNVDITSPSFYQPVSTAGGFFGAGGPRAAQFGLRFGF